MKKTDSITKELLAEMFTAETVSQIPHPNLELAKAD
jgi:hypothetical protein